MGDTHGSVATCLALFALMSLGARCGSDAPTEAIVPPAPTTVGTLSEESENEPIVRDATAIREALESAEADEAMTGVYDLLNRAGAEKDVHRGAEMIRSELPGLVAQMEASAPKVRARVTTVRLETLAGRGMRDHGLFILNEDVRLLRSFEQDLPKQKSAWGAAVRFGDRNNRLMKRSSARLENMFQHLPAAERAAIRKAVREVFGG